MANIIDQIHRDHQHWARLLAVIDSEIAKLMADEKPNLLVLSNAMQYMTYYPDIVHHPKEDALFERLKLCDPDSTDVVEAVRREHLTLLEKGQGFFETIKQTGKDGSFKEELVTKGRDYVSALRVHMNQEEDDLLKRARKLLSDDDLKQVQDVYEAYHDPLFGNKVEKKYHELYSYIVSQSLDTRY